MALATSRWALAQMPPATYHPSRVVIKLAEEDSRARVHTRDISIGELASHPAITEVLPLQNTLPKNVRIKESKYLRGIHILELNHSVTVRQVIEELAKYENVRYAEPLYGVELLEIPNDPAAQPSAAQYYLSIIKAYDAWSIATGSPDIVIGNIDTGVQLDHPDLADNLYYNLADPINGIDDDNNGYIDDHFGWDIANNDNDPSGDKSRHGTQVAGIHSGVANNGLGIAGVAYDSPFLAVKIFDSEDNRSFNSYGGIIYAADQGVKVMNLSWGSPNSFSQFNQDVINYAALEKDVVIVAAAGNTNEVLDFYPASYDHVISVGSSDATDQKAGYATYSRYIDLLAPGTGIYSTNSNRSYISAPGSSFAAPQVAGAAALVRQAFPQYTAIQVAEQLRVTSDDIYAIANNKDYLGMLGNGRLNIHAALTSSGTIAMQMEDVTMSGDLGDILFADDTVRIGGVLRNYINLATNVSFEVVSTSAYATVMSEQVFVGQLAPGASRHFPEGTIKVYLSRDTPKNERIVLRLDFKGNGFTDRQFVVFTANPTFLEIQGGEATVTVSDNGNLGYEQDVFKNGNGLRYEDILISNQLGIIIATDTAHVADNTVNNFQSDTRDADFTVVDGIQYFFNAEADSYAEGSFEVSGGQFDILVEQKYMGWSELDALVMEYRLINRSDSLLRDVYLGALADLNTGYAIENKTAYDASHLLGYTYDHSQEHYAGVVALRQQVAGFRGIDLGDYHDNVEEVEEILSDSMKYAFVSSGFSKTEAGTIAAGNYVAQLMSTKLDVLTPNVPVKRAFAYVFGASLAAIQDKARLVRARYDQLISKPPLLASYQVCSGGEVTIALPDGDQFDFYTDIALSQPAFSGNNWQLDDVRQDRTYYVINTDQPYPGDVRRVEVEVAATVAQFELPADTFIIDEVTKQITITDASLNSNEWSWDFDNGLFSSQQNPTVNYTLPGVYTIRLTASSGTGCLDSASQKLVVLQRNPRPANLAIDYCEGQPVLLTFVDEKKYRVYDDVGLDVPRAEGNPIEISGISGDKVLYLTNASGAIESLPATIQLKQIAFPVDIRVEHDLTDLTSNRALLVHANVNPATRADWTIEGSTYSGRSVSHQWSGAPDLQVKLTVMDTITGCAADVIDSFARAAASAPVVQDTLVCADVPLNLSPDGEGPFIYYADASKNQIIRKGAELISAGLTGDTVIYVTSIAELLESEPVPWPITVEVFHDTIAAQPEMLLLSEARGVALNAVSDLGVNWIWSVNNSFFESIRSPVLFFDSAGTYQIRLESTNDSGCKSIATLLYQVAEVTSLADNAPTIKLYPNPTLGVIHVSSHIAIASVEVFTAGGELIASRHIGARDFVLDASTWSSGAYLLTMVSVTGEVYVQRILR